MDSLRQLLRYFVQCGSKNQLFRNITIPKIEKMIYEQHDIIMVPTDSGIEENC